MLGAFLLWLLLSGSDESEPDTVSGPVLERTATTQAELADLSQEIGHPIYWIGPKAAQLEVARDAEGEVFLRYLEGDAEPGDSREEFLTIGTYPFPDATARLEELAQEPGALANATPDGGFVLTNEDNPTSVYLAYPDEDLQIEIFDPDPGRAFKLASSGKVVPVQ